jgi:hypothetical protein
MSGRALVEFIDYHLNIGWFDIDLDYLKVVDKPAPKEKAPAAKKKAPAVKKQASTAEEKKLSPLEMARQQDAAGKGGAAAKPAPAKKKMSVAEMLAAARGEKSEDAAPAPVEEAPPAEPEPAAAEPAAESSADGVVKVDRSSMSVAEMIAYCREKDAS